MRSRRELWDLREWLPTHEAALYLSNDERRFSEGELLRLALDGRIKVYVHLPAPVGATPQAGTPRGARRTIEGLWEVLMQGGGRLEVEARYHALSGLSHVNLDGVAGALVSKEGEVWQLPADRGVATGLAPRSASALPGGGVLAMRAEELRAFAAMVESAAADPVIVRTTLGSRERSTLLTIIAALARKAEIDFSKPSKAALQIEALTEGMGARVAARTIENHLKRIPEALERRGDDGDSS